MSATYEYGPRGEMPAVKLTWHQGENKPAIWTAGGISALFGLQNKIIDQRQYTILVSVVILSTFVPTLIAQKFFQSTVEAMHAWGRLYRKRMRVLSVEDVGDNGDMKNE